MSWGWVLVSPSAASSFAVRAMEKRRVSLLPLPSQRGQPAFIDLLKVKVMPCAPHGGVVKKSLCH